MMRLVTAVLVLLLAGMSGAWAQGIGSSGVSDPHALTSGANATAGALQQIFNKANKLLPTAGSTIPSALYGSGACTLGWNLSGGGGQTSLICDKDGGSAGGIWLMDTNSGAPRHMIDIEAAGVSIPYTTNEAAPGPVPPPIGTGGLSVTRTGASFFDGAFSARGITTTPGNGAFGAYLVGEINHGSGINSANDATEHEARNWTSVNNGVYTAGTGFPPRALFPPVFDGAHGLFPISDQSDCSDPDGFGCYIAYRMAKSGLYPAPFLAGIYGEPGYATRYGIFLDDAAAGAGPATSVFVRNQGNLQYASAISSLGATGNSYTANCIVTLTDTNSAVKTVIVVDTVSGGAISTEHIAIPGTTNTVPSNPVASTNNCGGSGATFNMTYTLGSPWDVQVTGSQVAANPAFRILKSDGTTQAQINQEGDVLGHSVGIQTGSFAIPNMALDVGGSTSAQTTNSMPNPEAFIGFPGSGASGFGGVILGAGANGNTPSIASSFSGAGAALPLRFYTNGTLAVTISTAQAVAFAAGVTATAYTVGATAGASCTLTTVSHLTVVNGIVTLCN